MAMISSEIFPICTYLPAKSLYRFKTVSKGFSNLPEEDFFLVNHVRNSLKRLWKPMEKGFCAGGRNMKFNMPVHENGVINFISDCGSYITKGSPYFEPYIMSYNIKDGTSTMLKLSKTARNSSTDKKCDMSIFNWGKVSMASSSICLVRLKKSTFKVWILKDYKTSRWRRIMKVKTKEVGLKEKYPTTITGFTVMNGELLIFATEKYIYSCGLTGENYMKIKEICENKCKYYVSLTSYMDTLRPCGPRATPLPC